MKQTPDVVSRRTVLKTLGASTAIGMLGVTPSLADDTFHGGSDCSEFTATMRDDDGNIMREFAIPDDDNDVRFRIGGEDVGSTLHLDGKYVEFGLDLDTFTVTNYTLTEANPIMTEDEDVVVFDRKEPLHGKTLDGELQIRLRDGRARIDRESSVGLDMKVQTKDCTQGGIFQMEPEDDSNPETTIEHTLGPGFYYYYDDQGRVMLTNGPKELSHGDVLARESPQLASLESNLQEGDTTSRWSVQDGGRMGFVAGEDAVE